MNEFSYRQAAYGLILNSNNELLMVYKQNSQEWDLPGGGIEGEESIIKAVNREIMEELSITNLELLHQVEQTNQYDWSLSDVEKHYKKTGIIRMGQEQHFVVFEYFGTDEQLNIQTDEIEKYKWVPLSQLNTHIKHSDLYNLVKNILKEHNYKVSNE